MMVMDILGIALTLAGGIMILWGLLRPIVNELRGMRRLIDQVALDNMGIRRKLQGVIDVRVRVAEPAGWVDGANGT